MESTDLEQKIEQVEEKLTENTEITAQITATTDHSSNGDEVSENLAILQYSYPWEFF